MTKRVELKQKRGKPRRLVKICGISSENKYYVYRHIRLDKNEPFYIGIGSKYDNCSNEYMRARNAILRNDIWLRIVDKTDFRIEIIYESDCYQDVINKEIEFILLYGRMNNQTGILANLTDGGEGTRNVIFSKERRLLCINNAGKKASEETKNKMSESQKERWAKGTKTSVMKEIFQYSLDGFFVKRWESAYKIQTTTGLTHTNILKALKKSNNYACHYFWFYEYRGNKIEVNDSFIFKRFPIEQLDINKNLIKRFDTIKEASIAIYNNLTFMRSIANACKKDYLHRKEFYFRYGN